MERMKEQLRNSGMDLQEDWSYVYERIRFEDDDRTLRPLVVVNYIKCQTKFQKTQRLSDLRIYFCIFDFFDETIVKSLKITEPYVRLSRINNGDWKSFVRNICLT